MSSIEEIEDALTLHDAQWAIARMKEGLWVTHVAGLWAKAPIRMDSNGIVTFCVRGDWRHIADSEEEFKFYTKGPLDRFKVCPQSKK